MRREVQYRMWKAQHNINTFGFESNEGHSLYSLAQMLKFFRILVNVNNEIVFHLGPRAERLIFKTSITNFLYQNPNASPKEMIRLAEFPSNI